MSLRSVGSHVLGRAQAGELLVFPTVTLPAPSCFQCFLEADSLTCPCLLMHFKEEKKKGSL